MFSRGKALSGFVVSDDVEGTHETTDLAFKTLLLVVSKATAPCQDLSSAECTSACREQERREPGTHVVPVRNGRELRPGLA